MNMYFFLTRKSTACSSHYRLFLSKLMALPVVIVSRWLILNFLLFKFSSKLVSQQPLLYKGTFSKQKSKSTPP